MFNLIFQLGLIAVCGILAFGWLKVIKDRDRRVKILQDSLMAMASDFFKLKAKYNELKEFNDLDTMIDYVEDFQHNGLFVDDEGDKNE